MRASACSIRQSLGSRDTLLQHSHPQCGEDCFLQVGELGPQYLGTWSRSSRNWHLRVTADTAVTVSTVVTAYTYTTTLVSGNPEQGCPGMVGG